jgi:hypothetical protein
VVNVTFTNFSVEYRTTSDCTTAIACATCTYDHVTLYDGTSQVPMFYDH